VSLALLSLALCLPFGLDSPFVVSAAVFGLLMIPVAGIFRASSGWPRTLLMTYTGLLALVGIGALALASVETLAGTDGVGGLRGAWKDNIVFCDGHVEQPNGRNGLRNPTLHGEGGTTTISRIRRRGNRI
jgi:hypothetical protein